MLPWEHEKKALCEGDEGWKSVEEIYADLYPGKPKFETVEELVSWCLKEDQ